MGALKENCSGVCVRGGGGGRFRDCLVKFGLVYLLFNFFRVDISIFLLFCDYYRAGIYTI